MNKKTIKNLYGLGDYNTNQMKSAAQLFEMERQSPNLIYNRRPDAAPNPDQHIKSIELEELSYIIPDAFAGSIGIELITNLDIKQLEKIGQEGDAYLKQAIKIALRKALAQEGLSPQVKSHLTRIQNYIWHNPAWQL